MCAVVGEAGYKEARGLATQSPEGEKGCFPEEVMHVSLRHVREVSVRGVGWGEEEEEKVETEERQEEGEEEAEQSGERRRKRMIIFCGWRGSVLGPAATSDWLLGYYFLPEKHTPELTVRGATARRTAQWFVTGVKTGPPEV